MLNGIARVEEKRECKTTAMLLKTWTCCCLASKVQVLLNPFILFSSRGFRDHVQSTFCITRYAKTGESIGCGSAMAGPLLLYLFGEW